MSSLLRVTDADLLREVEASRFPWLRAIALSFFAGSLAVVGMQLEYAPGDATPLPGMDHLLGQLKWAFALSALSLIHI